jgi:hypothetical protein
MVLIFFLGVAIATTCPLVARHCLSLRNILSRISNWIKKLSIAMFVSFNLLSDYDFLINQIQTNSILIVYVMILFFIISHLPFQNHDSYRKSSRLCLFICSTQIEKCPNIQLYLKASDLSFFLIYYPCCISWRSWMRRVNILRKY